METKDLYQFVLVLVLVGLIAGVGVLLLDKLGTSEGVLKDTQVLNETHLISSRTFTVDNIDGGISGVSLGGTNVTITVPCATSGSVTCNYSSSTGVITTNESIGDAPVSVNYTYSANTTSTDAFHSARDAVADVPENWLSLVVTIGILAVILGLVLASFVAYKRR